MSGHFGLSVVPFDGTGTTNLLTGFTNQLVVDATGVTSILADGTRTGPVPLINGTRVGKAYVYTVDQILIGLPDLPSSSNPTSAPSSALPGTTPQSPSALRSPAPATPQNPSTPAAPQSPLPSGTASPTKPPTQLSPTSSPAPLPATAAASPNQGTISGLSSSAIIGIAVGITLPLLIGAAALTWWLRRTRSKSVPGSGKQPNDALTGSVDVQVVLNPDVPSGHKQAENRQSGPGSPQPFGVACPTDIQGILVNDVFLRSTAHNYSWTTSNLLQQPMQALQAGINDNTIDNARLSSVTGPVVQLTSQELQQQVYLFSDGLLGRGATALVFKCVWPSRFGPNTVLAAKLVKDAYDANVHVLESFMHEAAVLASLQHPNIIRMYGYCLEPPTVCLLLELLPMSLKDLLYRGIALPTAMPSANSTAAQTSTGQGRHLDSTNTRGSVHDTCTTSSYDAPTAACNTTRSKHKPQRSAEDTASADSHMTEASPVQAHRPLTCRQMVCLSKDIAAGLSYMHSNTASDLVLGAAAAKAVLASSFNRTPQPQPKDKVVHRDLKPANILINSRGIPKISDFGLARQHEHTSVATINLGVGTLPYMAPEALVGSQAGVFGQPVTNRVDIYSLGIMLWEMATGIPPWQGMAEMAILAAVTKRQRPPLPPDEECQPSGSLSTLADQHARPFAALNAVIRSCWQQRDLKRPQAAEVHDMLAQILTQMETETVA